MAAKEACVPLQRHGDDEKPLQAWQMAWIRRHNDTLVERMSTMDIVDQLNEVGRMDTKMDVYQKIESQSTIPNERARLLLGFVKKQCSACFWDFQNALAADSASSDLAIARKDEQVIAGSFSAEELTAAFFSGWEEGRPASVVTVNKKLKERYRDLKMPSLDVEAGRKPVSLAEIRVNICLLSADKLDALCGSPGQSQPFKLDSLKGKDVIGDQLGRLVFGTRGEWGRWPFDGGRNRWFRKEHGVHSEGSLWVGQGGLRGTILGSVRFVLHGKPNWPELVEGQRSGGGVWTWSLRSDRGGAEGSGRIHVRSLGGDSSRGGFPRRSRRGQALTALADSLRQVPGLTQASCNHLFTSLRENAVAVQALPPQPAIGGRWLHRWEDCTVRRGVLHSEPPKGSWSSSAAGQSPGCPIADAHAAPGNDDLSPFSTGESTSKHPDRCLPVSDSRHVTADNGARNGGDSRQHPWRSVSSGLERGCWESVQASVRRSRREEGGVQEVRASSGGLPRNSRWAGLPVVNAERKHRRARGGRILVPTPHHARVFCCRSRRSRLHPPS